MAVGVEFDEDRTGFGGPKPTGAPSAPGMNAAPVIYSGSTKYVGTSGGLAGWLLAHGWVKSEHAAQFVMLGIVAVNIVITIVVIKLFL